MDERYLSCCVSGLPGRSGVRRDRRSTLPFQRTDRVPSQTFYVRLAQASREANAHSRKWGKKGFGGCRARAAAKKDAAAAGVSATGEGAGEAGAKAEDADAEARRHERRAMVRPRTEWRDVHAKSYPMPAHGAGPRPPRRGGPERACVPVCVRVSQSICLDIVLCLGLAITNRTA